MFMNKLVPVDVRDIWLNAPLAQSIYDSHGRLLLRRGLAVGTQRELEHLLAVGMKEAVDVAPAVVHAQPTHSVFEQTELVAARLAMLYQRLREEPDWPEFAVLVGKIADAILTCCEKDGDAAFAMAHLDCRHGYDTVHHVMAAVIAARIALAQKWAIERRRALVSAVLTLDIALLPHRRLLEADAQLSAEHEAIVHRHPDEGASWLERLGVRDVYWLRCVRQHHRGLNGSGYPAGSDPIDVEARIATLADAFSAMLRPRPYRGRIPATKALAGIYANAVGRYDGSLINVLIREVGIFPPGSVVRLANGETGIVVRTPPDALNTPEVWVLADISGHLLLRPRPCDSSLPTFTVVGLGKLEICLSMMQAVAQLWSRAKPATGDAKFGTAADEAPPQRTPFSRPLAFAPS